LDRALDQAACLADFVNLTAAQEVVESAEAEGTAFIAYPLHCAVGIKP
jgi:hypothetical protein